MVLLDLVGEDDTLLCRFSLFSSSFGIESGAEEALIASPFVP